MALSLIPMDFSLVAQPLHCRCYYQSVRPGGRRVCLLPYSQIFSQEWQNAQPILPLPQPYASEYYT